MKPFAITVVSGLLFVGSIVYWADPGNRWSGDQFPKRALQPGEILVNPKSNLDDRALRFSQLAYIDSPDLVVFGSSRALLVNASLFKKQVRVYNLAVTVTKVEDYVAFWQTLKKTGKIPKYILIFVDPWVFNKNATFQYHHVTHRLAEEFSFTKTTPKGVGALFERVLHHSAWSQAIYFITTLPEMMKGMEFKYALIQLALYHNRAPKLEIMTANNISKQFHGYRSDGSCYMHVPPKPLKQMQQETLQEIPRLTNGMTFYHWLKDDNALAMFDLFLKNAETHGVRLFLILPPYQQTALQWFQADRASSSAMQQYEKSVVSMASAHPNLPVCNAIDPAFSHCPETEFTDWIHTNETCTKKVLTACFERSRSWKELLAP